MQSPSYANRGCCRVRYPASGWGWVWLASLGCDIPFLGSAHSPSRHGASGLKLSTVGTLLMPAPGDRCPGFIAEAGRCWRMLYDDNLQATTDARRHYGRASGYRREAITRLRVWACSDHRDGPTFLRIRLAAVLIARCADLVHPLCESGPSGSIRRRPEPSRSSVSRGAVTTSLRYSPPPGSLASRELDGRAPTRTRHKGATPHTRGFKRHELARKLFLDSAEY